MPNHVPTYPLAVFDARDPFVIVDALHLNYQELHVPLEEGGPDLLVRIHLGITHHVL